MAKNITNKTTNKPKISVIMSVYNGERYLKYSIDSVLNQTYGNFEFIIINDGSTDKTLELIKGYDDPRIILINRKNKGLVYSLNEGIDRARGEYIARQDDDDISMKDRFEIQLKLISNSDYAVVGGSIRIIDEKGNEKGIHGAITNDEALREESILRGAFAHGTAFGRAGVFKEYKYDSSKWPAEDFDLWVRMQDKYKLGNTERTIYKYRENLQGISSKNKVKQQNMKNKISNIAKKIIKLEPVSLKQILKSENNKDTKKRIVKNRIKLIGMGLVHKKYLPEAFLYGVIYGVK